jgi:hypothetical protein
MALSVIRRFDDTDAERLNAAALRFAARHRLSIDLEEHANAWQALDGCLWCGDTGTYPRILDLKRLWQACRCRALGVPVAADIAVAHGYVGRSC